MSKPSRSSSISSSEKKHIHYKGKTYSTAQARAGFAGPANKRKYR